jgi:membrane associated rhomboid family serine protease
MSQSITLAIVIITVIVSLVSFNNAKVINDLSMWPVMIDNRKQYYRFLTSGFVHGDFMHLAFNMFTLYSFGAVVESYIFVTPLGYIAFYLLALIVSDIPSYLKHKQDYGYRSIGASGAVSAVLFACILLSPWANIRLMGIIKIPFLVYAVLWIVYSLYARRRNMDNINHDAHLFGALFGVVAAIVVRPELVQIFLEELMHPNFNLN